MQGWKWSTCLLYGSSGANYFSCWVGMARGAGMLIMKGSCIAKQCQWRPVCWLLQVGSWCSSRYRVWLFPSLGSNLVASSFGCSGLSSKVGGWVEGIDPILVKAGDFCRNFDSALIPFLELRIEGRAMLLDTFSSMSWCYANLGHSLIMCSLISKVSLSQGQVIRSGERGGRSTGNLQCMHVQFSTGWCSQRLPCCSQGFWSGEWDWRFYPFAIAYLPVFPFDLP